VVSLLEIHWQPHLLIGMGLDEFSMSLNAIPDVKEMIRRWSVSEASDFVNRVLQMPDVKSVLAFLRQISKTVDEQ